VALDAAHLALVDLVLEQRVQQPLGKPAFAVGLGAQI
jgi:hypothetical protein